MNALRSRLSAPLPIAGLFSLVVLWLYLTRLTDTHTYDALSYVSDVEQKPWQELFHPHHLAYGPMGALLKVLMEALGWDTGMMLPLQVVNAFAGALGVGMFFVLGYDQTRRHDIALAMALLLSTSYAWWYYAVEVEVYTIAAVFLIGCLWFIAKVLTAPSAVKYGILGFLQGIAVLFHQTNVFLCIPVLLTIVIPRKRFREYPELRYHPLMWGLSYGASLGMVGGGSYLLVGFTVANMRSWKAFFLWATAYAQTGWWGKPLDGQSWERLGIGLSQTIAQPGGALLGLLLVGLLVFFLRRLLLVHRNIALCLMSWILSYGAFFIWWEPDNIEFWIASLPPTLFLLGLALRTAGKPWHAGIHVALAIGLTMGIVNDLAIRQRGNVDQDIRYQRIQALALRSTPDDFFILADELEELLLSYAKRRPHTWLLNRAITEHGGNWSGTCRQLQQRIETTLEQGASVFIVHEMVDPFSHRPPSSALILERFGVRPEVIAECFATYRTLLHPVAMPVGLPEVYRIPSATAMLEHGGWDFSVGHRWGWRAHHVHDEQLGSTGWLLWPGVDPQLISPPFRSNFSQFAAIEIRLAATATTTAPATFALFFVDAHGVIAADYAVQRTLHRDGQPRTYRIRLQDRAHWSGSFTRLRLDPIETGDGGWVRVEFIRVVRRTSE